MSLFQPMMVAALLLGGLGVAVLGSVKVSLAKRLAIDEARVGGLVSIFGFIIMPGILTAGILNDVVGSRPVLIAGCAAMACSLALLAAARSYAVALTGVLGFGAGWSLLTIVANVLVDVAFSGRGVEFAASLANVFFGLGAFLTPLAAGFLAKRVALPRVLVLFAGAALVPPILALGVDGAVWPAPMGLAPGWLPALIGDPTMWLCGFLLFFYGPMEASMGAWTTPYLSGRGVSEGRAAVLLSGFWLAFVGARLVAAYTLPPGRGALVILILALICVGLMAAIVASRGRGLAGALVLAAGVCFGPIFPLIIAIFFSHVESSVRGRAVGMLFAVGGVGWTLIPMLLGAYAQRTSVQRAFVIAAGAAAGLSGVALLLLLR